MRQIFALLLGSLCPYVLFAQTNAIIVFGKITTEDSPLPFANVYVKNTTIGTTTNETGDYQIQLPKGTHTLIYQFIGYQRQEIVLTVEDQPLRQDVDLQAESYELKELVVVAGEDPAYPIMRQAMAKRKTYLQQIDNYSCDTYIKGLMSIADAPSKFLGQEINIEGLDSNRSGIIYLSESVSNYHYQRPDDYKENIISSKVSGNDRGFSFNRASSMEFNFYKNLVELDFAARGLVSPIARNALLYYHFRLEGSFTEGKHTIHKIKVMPKRTQDPVFSGYIYIQDQTWRIHSTDLVVYNNPMVEFVDSLVIQQTFAPYNEEDSIWVRIAQRFYFGAKIVAFKLHGTYLATYANYSVNKKFEKPFFRGEVVRIEEGANKRDSTYWEQIRPVPLTTVEQVDYQQKDSIKLVRNSKAYKDSIDQRGNKPNVGSILATGYSHDNSYRKRSLFFSPLLASFSFNTVEGLVTQMNVDYRKRFDNKHILTVQTNWRYGWGNRHFNPHAKIRYRWNQLNFSFIAAAFGSKVSQWDAANPVPPFMNSFFSLWGHKNFLKIYEQRFGQVRYGRELINGVQGSIQLGYHDRHSLSNTTEYSWRGEDFERTYTSNEAPIPIERHQALLLDVVLDIRFKQQYERYPDRKFIYGSKYPKLQLRYRKGISKWLGSDVNFDQLQLRIFDEMDFSVLGESQYNVVVGGFLNNKAMSFVDYQQFNGNEMILARDFLNHFQTTKYYQFFTNEFYVKAHYEHHFNGFIWNKLPLIRRLKWRMVTGVNAFYVNQDQYFAEAFVGIDNIFKIMRLDYVHSLTHRKQWGIRLGLGIF